MELFKLMGTIAISNGEAIDALNETSKTASSAHGKISSAFSKIGSAALSMGKIVAAGFATIGTGLVALGTMAVNYNAQLEQYQTSLEVMLGSQEKAVETMEKLKEVAAKTPFELSDLASTTQLLLNYGFSADEATERMLMLGDISQGSADKMQRIATAYGQMSSAGKVSLEDIKQMIEAGFNPLQEMSDSTGESMESLYARISAGTMTVDEISASMERATSEGGKYYQSMEKQSQTLTGQLSTLKDTVNNALGEAFQSVSDLLASDIIPRLSELASTYIPKLGEVVSKLAPTLMQIIDTILPILLDTIDSLLPLFVQFVDELIPMLGDTLTSVLPLLLQMIQEVLPVLLQTISEILPQLLPLVVDILPILTELLMILLPPLAQLLPQALGILVPKLQQMCDMIEIYLIPAVEMLVEWLGDVLGDTFKSVGLLIEGLIDIITGVFSFISSWLEAWRALLSGDFEGWFEAVKEAWAALGQIILGLLKSMFSGLITWFTESWETIKGFFVTAWEWCVSAFDSVVEFVGGIFEDIYESIKEKIEKAIQFVKDGIDKLKSFFDFEWSLPKLKMPHFKISGSFSLDPPSVPSFGVDWYAKGGIMTEPTAFGFNPSTGNVMVGGEAGAEAIAPITTLKQYVAEAVASQNEGLAEVMHKILEAILSMDANMGGNLREALAGTSFEVNNREFARLVKGVV